LLFSTGTESIRVWTGTGGPLRGPLNFELAFNDIYMPDSSDERYGILLDVGLATQVTGTVRRNDVFFGTNDQGGAMQLANSDAAMSLSVTDNIVWGGGFDLGIFIYQYGTLGSIDALLAGNEVGLFATGRPDLGALVTGLIANNAFTDNSFYGFGVETTLWSSVANRNNRDSGNGASGEAPTYDPAPGTVTGPARLDAANFYRPLPTSPVRDAGDSSAVPVAMTVDFNGNPRIAGAAAAAFAALAAAARRLRLFSTSFASRSSVFARSLMSNTARSQSQRQGARYTERPPTIVSSTRIRAIPAGSSSGERSSTTRSASFPASSDPLSPSWKCCRAASIVTPRSARNTSMR
jgi:hypothetical protein